MSDWSFDSSARGPLAFSGLINPPPAADSMPFVVANSTKQAGFRSAQLAALGDS
jgi:hypothetical protein